MPERAPRDRNRPVRRKSSEADYSLMEFMRTFPTTRRAWTSSGGIATRLTVTTPAARSDAFGNLKTGMRRVYKTVSRAYLQHPDPAQDAGRLRGFGGRTAADNALCGLT